MNSSDLRRHLITGMSDLAGKNAIVTGTAVGPGRAYAEALAGRCRGPCPCSRINALWFDDKSAAREEVDAHRDGGRSVT